MITRRDFLKGSAITAGLALTAPAAALAKDAKTSGSSNGNVYYPTGLSSNDPYDLSALAECESQAVDEQIKTAEESMTLLLNEDKALPLAEGSKVTLLGCSTVNEFLARKSVSKFDSVYTGWATGGYAEYQPTLRYVDAMKAVYDVNQAVIDAYSANTETYPGNGVQEGDAAAKASKAEAAMGAEVSGLYTQPIDAEAPASFYDDNGLTQTFSEYSDAAIVLLTRYGGEDNDLGEENGVGGISELALQPNEVELVKMVGRLKAAGTFKKVIYLINTANQIEIGSLPADGGADAIMWIGGPGFAGMKGVTNVLTGKVSPSGHLVDTIAANSLSAPACENATERTGIWANEDEILDYVGFTGDESHYSGKRNYNAYVVYAEDIYTGYKYYETRYEDCILGQGNANGDKGVFAGSGSWSYNDEISYPFGYGLSYTTFDQTLDGVAFDESSDKYTVSVTVTNTGDVAAPSVVQVYAQTPYGDYEKKNAIEKSAIQLVGFGRTKTLESGAKETVKIEVERYHLASYDSKGVGGYILSAGDYYLSVGDDAHDALNNVLAAKGATGMTSVTGEAAAGDASKTYKWNLQSMDSSSYKQSRVNPETRVTNLFQESDLNYWYDDVVTYLSRSDWEGTWPKRYKDVSLTCTQEMMDQLKGIYTKPENAPSVSDFKTGQDNGLTLIMMRDVELDDPAWNDYLDQFTLEQLTYLLNAGTEAIEELGIPAATQVDDGTTIGGSLLAVSGGDKNNKTASSPISWPCEQNTSATFDAERATERGRIMGLEAFFTGDNEVWYGGSNMHRTQFCGRNMQYYSEDPVIGYYAGLHEATGMQSVGTIYCGKHFAGNNQEYCRESASCFYTEQGFREGELKCFEGAVAEGGALSIMGGFNRTGLRYCNYYYNLQTGILRNEWGFKGHVTTDAVAGSLFKQNWGLNLAAGTDYFCFNAMLSSFGDNIDAVEGITTLVKDGDGYIMQCLRQAVKRSCYTWLHTWSINGLSDNTKIEKITPWWQTALNGATAVFGIGAVASAAAFVYSSAKAGTETKETAKKGGDE